MKIAKVIGTIWATRKEERLNGYKLLIVQPVNILNGALDRAPIVAADMIGAGVGETVIIVGGSSARQRGRRYVGAGRCNGRRHCGRSGDRPRRFGVMERKR